MRRENEQENKSAGMASPRVRMFGNEKEEEEMERRSGGLRDRKK